MKNNIYIGFNAIVANHNWSLSILYRGELHAIELERLNRLKEFPNKLYSKLLSSLQREMFGKIDEQTQNKETIISFRNYIDDMINDTLLKFEIDFNKVDNIYTINFPFDISVRGFENRVIGYKENNHHLFHAASAFYPSDFEEAVILCMDHDGFDEVLGGINSMHTIWHAKGNKIKHLYSDEFSPKKAQAGIGAVYENHSYICGIGEGTFMGLSGYGKNNLDHIKIFDYSTGGVLLSKDLLSKQSYEGINDFRNSIISSFKKVYKLDKKEISESIENSIFSDIADKVQNDIEEAILFLAKKAYDLTGCKNICIAGGVGLNILANNRVLKELSFEKLFVQPACNDAGLSLGGVYYLYHGILGNEYRIKLVSPGLGISYSNEKILESLKKYKDNLNFEFLGKNKYKKGAELLEQDNIIGWFQGSCEFGPRALGFRSLLASPKTSIMKFRMNEIKQREQYRPMAPIMMEDYIEKYLNTSTPSPYMTLVSDVLEDKKVKIPAVVHVDGTARYQTVNKEQNIEVYTLLEEFYNLSGISVLINTSFNAHNEPIVEEPKNAIEMFLSTDIDYLIMGDYLVSKDKKYLEYKFDKNKVEEKFNKDLLKSKNNNIRGNTLLKLMGLSKLRVDFNYKKGSKKVVFSYNNGSFEIEVYNQNKSYYKVYDKFGLINNLDKTDENIKLLKIIDLFLTKNSDIIFNLIKGI